MPPADSPAAMAAASPPLDPPGVRSSAHGLFVRPYSALSVSHAINCSATFVTPTTIAPAARSRATSGASASPVVPARNRVPVSHGMPFTATALLMLIGTPCRGPRRAPLMTARSDSRAALRAPSASMPTYALRAGLSASMRARVASTSSIGDRARRLTRAASVTADSSSGTIAQVYLLRCDVRV